MNDALKKAIELAELAKSNMEPGGSTVTEQLQKAHVKAYTRTTKNGNAVQVQEHDDSRQKKTTLSDLKKHPMWSESDHKYFKDKGYTHDQIKDIWDRDHAWGKEPLVHKKAPDVMGVIADPNHYKGK